MLQIGEDRFGERGEERLKFGGIDEVLREFTANQVSLSVDESLGAVRVAQALHFEAVDPVAPPA